MLKNEIWSIFIDKSQLKMDKRLKPEPETIKLPEENIKEKLHGIGLSNGFWNLFQKHMWQKQN